jgi:integrase
MRGRPVGTCCSMAPPHRRHLSGEGTRYRLSSVSSSWMRWAAIRQMPALYVAVSSQSRAVARRAATRLLEAGVHPKVVSEALGHSSVAFTLDVYSHVIPSMGEQVGVAMEAAIGPTGSKTGGCSGNSAVLTR